MRKILFLLLGMQFFISVAFAQPRGGITVTNLTSGEVVTLSQKNGEVVMSNGLYARDRIRIELKNNSYHLLKDYGWAVSFFGGQEEIIEPGSEEILDNSIPITITYNVPYIKPFPSSLMGVADMRVCFHYGVGIGVEISKNNESDCLSDCFIDFKLNEGLRYKVTYPGDGPIIIISPDPIKPPFIRPLSMTNNTVPKADLYDLFGNLKKTVLLRSDRTEMDAIGLSAGPHVLKIHAAGNVLFTETIMIH